MKIIKNKIIPFSGRKALCIWPLLFVRSVLFSEKDLRHEKIHGKQQKEMIVIAAFLMLAMMIGGCGWWSFLALPLYFYVYGLLWLYVFANTGDADYAYKNNPLEQEAYFFDSDEGYLDRRRPFAWFNFLKF